jgi:hypothetical protein
MAKTNPRLKAALYYAAELGWPVFPIYGIGPDEVCTCARGATCDRPGKHPITKHGLHDASTDEERIRRWWATHPSANVGIACGAGAGFWVLDVDDREQLHELFSEQGPEWSETWTQHTGGGGLHLFFEFKGDGSDPSSRVGVFGRAGVDVRSEGGYIVVAPSLHASGKEYEFDDLNGLAPWSEGAELRAAPDWLLAKLASRGRTAPPGDEAAHEGLLEPEEVRDIRSALNAIEVGPGLRDVWVRVGMALKSTGAGQQAFGLWRDWAQQSEKQPSMREARRVWDSFGADCAVGVSTLFYMARENGWVDLEVSSPAAATLPVPAEAALPDQDQEPGEPPTDRNPLPPGALAVEGLLGELTEEVERRSYRPQPLLGLGASLAALGTVFGRRWRCPLGTRTNLFVLGLGPTGCGKDAARQVCKDAFLGSGLQKLLGGERLASGVGVLSALKREPRQLFLLDEFGELMRAVTDPRGGPHLKTVLPILMQIYSSAKGLFLGQEYADRKGDEPRQDLFEPHACLYATSTPESFFDGLRMRQVHDGFLNRFLVLPVRDPRPQVNDGLEAGPISSDLLAHLTEAEEAGRQGDAQPSLADIAAQETGAPGKSEARELPFEGAAQEAFKAFELDLDARYREAPEARFWALWQRVVENSRKVAMIRALGREPGDPLVTEEDARWALSLVAWATRDLEALVSSNVHEDHVGAQLARVRDAIPEGSWLTKSELLRVLRMRSRDLDELLKTLTESGDLMARKRETGGRGRPAIEYRAKNS